MSDTEFDRYAEDYDTLFADCIAPSGEEPSYFADYKIRDIAREVRRTGYPARAPGDSGRPRICDFGAGVGTSVPYVRHHLPEAELTCLDVSRRSLERAESRYPGLARYVHLDGPGLPLEDDHFDLAFAACVFHHIQPESHLRWFRELRRVLRADGTLFVFEHNPWNPLTVRTVENCPFDENAELIPGTAMRRSLVESGFRDVRIRFRIFFPRALRWLRPLERAMTWLPLGAQYCALARK